MKLNIKELSEERAKLMVFTLLMTGIAVAQVLFWPTISKMLPAIVDKIPELLRGFVDSFIAEGFSYFIITQQFIKNIGMFGGFFAVLIAASAIARERENGTLEFLLAQPISRTRVLTEKYLINMVFLAVPVLISTMANYFMALTIGETIDPFHIFLAGIYGFFVLAIVYSFTFCVGVFIDNQMHVISGGLVLVFTMGILVFFEATKFLSLYSWLDREYLGPVINSGIVPWNMIAVFIVINAALFSVALYRFRKINV